MTGKYGTLRAYVSAYAEYGGTPPIPDWADETRGEERGRVPALLVAVVCLTAAAIPVANLALIAGVTTTSSVAVLTTLVASWLGIQMLFQMTAGQPFLDWYADIPRRGLPQVDRRAIAQEVTEG